MVTAYLILSLFLSGTQHFPSDFKPFHWLVGKWEMPRPQGGFRVETWKVKSKNEFSGMDFKVIGLDTTFMENIQLVKDQEGIWYIPTVPDQNQGQAVKFKLTQVESKSFFFENPEHDFPQRIIYHFKPLRLQQPLAVSSGDTLDVDVVTLEGEGISFRFFRK